MPTVELEGSLVKIIAGKMGEVSGPIEDQNTDAFYFDLNIAPESAVTLDVPRTHRCFIYCYAGEAKILSNGTEIAIPTHSLATISNGDALSISSTQEATRLIFVGGKPINEEIVQYGPFVMNTRHEIEAAINDYHNGQLVRERAAFITDS